MRSPTLLTAFLLLSGCSDSPGEERPGTPGKTRDPGSSGGQSSEENVGAGGSDSSGASGGNSAGGTASTGSASATGGSPSTTPRGNCQTTSQKKSYTPPLFSSGDDPSTEATCSLVNPERGLRAVVDLLNLGNVSTLRQQGHSTVYGYVLIPDYVDKDLDAQVLDPLEASLASLRTAGLKVILRVYYAPAMDPDAPLSRVLSHIAQLKPLLRSNSDVIAAMHAGFVGAWGEWHSSTNQLTEPAARKAILDALLDALPADRMILARRPSHKSEAYGGPLTEETAYSPSPLSRVGHLNDCFLASDSDFGTYQAAGEREYARADSAFTLVEGETCAVNPPRSECASALDELAAHHWSLLNIAYHGDVLDSWRAGGCFEQIACRLGYRYALLGLEHDAQLSPGSVLNLKLSLLNDGFARAFNPRPAYLVLQGEASRHELSLDLELRELAPGVEASFCLGAQLPTNIAPGEYRLGLWLPDAAESLKGNADYAVQLSNDVDWSDGANFFDSTILVE